MLAPFLSAYFTLNLLVALAWGILFLASKLRPMSQSVILRFHYFALPLVLACTLASPLMPGQNFEHSAKVWSATSLRDFSEQYKKAEGSGFLNLPAASKAVSFGTEKVGWISGGTFALLLLALAYRLTHDLRSLFRIRRRSFTVKKLAGITITTNDEITVPFTYWLPGELTLVLPTDLLGSPTDYKIAVAHELQHHRQQDTRWIYGIWMLRTLCAPNPFAHLWARWVMETQEFACDEALVHQKKVNSQAYARCLVTVAETANRQNFIPACATGLIFLAERNLLRRRIESMKQAKRTHKQTALALGAILLTALSATAYAAKGLVQDRRVTIAQAQAMKVVAQKDSSISIEVNEAVVRQLNRFLGTADGRAYMRASLQRMESHRRMVEETIARYNAPPELLALPLWESGYRNLEEAKNFMKAAGVWQFIPSTARKYGMRVDEQVDERLNVEKETDAAIRYLTSNFLFFSDWRLSLMGYNMGEGAVQKGIEKHGTRDPWKLIKLGVEGDSEYLAGFMAVLIIMKNPGSLD